MAYPSPRSPQFRFTYAVYAAVIAAGLAGAGVPGAAAQAVSGSIGGIVKDSTGAVVPGATITITSLERKTVDTTVSNESGFYLKDRLLPGLDYPLVNRLVLRLDP